MNARSAEPKRLACLVLAAVLAAGCGGESPTGPAQAPVATVTVTPTPDTISTGATAQLTATTKDAAGNVLTGRTVTWSSDNIAVATVSGTGLVTGVAVGAAMITATSEGKNGPAAITVVVPVASVTLTPSAATILSGDTLRLTATPKDAAGNPLTGRPVAWSSSNPAVATVSTTGLVTGVGQGSATITAAVGGQNGTAGVSVNVLNINGVWDWVEQFTDQVHAITCSDTGSYVFSQTGAAFTGTSEQVGTCTDPSGSYDNTASDVVTSGQVTGRNISFTVGGCPYTAVASGTPPSLIAGQLTCSFVSGGVTFNFAGTWSAGPAAPVASIALLPAPGRVLVGGTLPMVAALKTAAGRRVFGRSVTWSSSNQGVATVSTSGVVSGVSSGSVTITATAEGKSAMATVTVELLTLASVSAGGFSTCGVTTGGAAYCWGANDAGNLGDGTRTQRTTPVAVVGGLTFASVSAAIDHTCGVTTSGAAYCWGRNDAGQLGNGSTNESLAPVAVSGGLTFASVSAGGLHTCGVTGGAIYCWGFNGNGELGNGSTTNSATPVAVSGGFTFGSVSASLGSHTCGVTTTGGAYCWGFNSTGQLGNGSTNGSRTPGAVMGSLTFGSVSAGDVHTCGVTTGGASYCWGDNSYGQLGDASTTQRTAPVAVSGGLAFASVSAGGFHTCGRTAGGSASCWGRNDVGELGDGSTIQRTAPVAVSGGLAFAPVSAGGFHVCGLTTGGTAYCWGYNFSGQLGNGATADSSTPVRVAGQP